MNIYLKYLINGRFRFYIIDNYRHMLFKKLKFKYGTWLSVAEHIGIGMRHLFGFRRGWELRNKRKTLFLINYEVLIKISKILKIKLTYLEKNIIYVKQGQTGRTFKVNFPLKIDLKKIKTNSVEALLFDYKTFIDFILKLNREYYNFNESNKIISIKPIVLDQYLKELISRGLSPSFLIIN